MSTGHRHDHAGDGHADHDHDHKAAPMVEEITDYEVLEIAVRELAIEHGLFTAEAGGSLNGQSPSVRPTARGWWRSAGRTPLSRRGL
jgi:thiocyanate hydrolase subunit gamma